MAQHRLYRVGAAIYDAGVERERVARIFGALMWGAEMRPMYEGFSVISAQPA